LTSRRRPCGLNDFCLVGSDPDSGVPAAATDSHSRFVMDGFETFCGLPAQSQEAGAVNVLSMLDRAKSVRLLVALL